VDPTAEEWRVIDLAVALGLQEVEGLLRAVVLREIRDEYAHRDREEAEELFQRLKGFSPADRRVLAEGGPEYHTWAFCVRLCDESERAAAHSADQALEWAEIACTVARQVPGSEAFRSHLCGFAEPFRGNSLRVKGDLPDSAAAFVEARKLRLEGADEAGLLDEGRVLDLEASLRRTQGLFSEALKLHDEALEIAQPDQTGAILLNKAATLEEKGDYEASIIILEQAGRSFDEQSQPRLFLIQRYNLAGTLIRLGRAEAAVPIVQEVRELAERLRNDLDLVRTLWIEAQLLAALGRREEAVAALEQVRRDFDARSMPFDFGLASLDLALVYRDQGRLAEVQRLAAEMLKIFEATRVHREALAAVILFRDAAEKGEITIDLMKRLQDYLKKARTNPKLRFSAPSSPGGRV
jgi:tetratricopeptide (TPR) repeat protein